MKNINILHWDSAHFGFPIARISTTALSPAEAEQAISWAKQEGVRCIYFLTDAADADSAVVAKEHGFSFVDERVSYESQNAPPARPIPADITLTNAAATDLASLQDISANSFTASRFYRDPHFDRAKASELYRTWITNSLQKGEETVVVARTTQLPVAGYVTFRHQAQTTTIGLISVHERARGQGFGRVLMEEVWRRAQAQPQAPGAHKVHVVTQGENTAARHLYEKLGFVRVRSEHWYHRWL